MFAHLLSITAVCAYAFAAFAYLNAYYPLRRFSSGAGPSFPGNFHSRIPLRLILLVGLVCHAGFLVSSDLLNASFNLPRLPFTISLISVIVVALFLAFEKRLQITALGAFVAPLALIFLIASAVFFHLSQSGEPAEHSGALLDLHFFFILGGYALFAISFCASAAFLATEALIKRKRPVLSGGRLPSLQFLDRTNRFAVIVGEFFLIAGIACGSFYSKLFEASSEAFVARVSWALPMLSAYALLGLWMSAGGARGRRTIWASTFAFAAVVISFFGAGVHSGSFHVH